MGRLARKEWLWVALGALALGCLFGYPILRHLDQVGSANDWDQHLLWYWVPIETLRKFHQFPLWNPWACGGTPMLGNSQSRILTPFLLLQLLLGNVVGLHVDMVLHLALAIAGAYVLGRVVGLSPLGAAAPALIYVWSSTHYLHLAEGHGWALTYADAPWCIAAAYYAMDRRRLAFAALAGLGLGLMINEGGIYPAPHTALMIGLLALALAAHRRDPFPLLVVAVVGGVGFLASAAKLLPVYELMKHDPRKVDSSESTGWPMLRDALFSHDQSRYRPMPRDRWYWGYQEYGAYLGPVGALLVVVGLLARGEKRRWPWALAALVFLSLGLGDFGENVWKEHPTVPLSPWAALHKLPLFSSQHVPSRFLTLFTLALGLVAGFGAELLRGWRRPWGPALVVALLAGGALDAWRVDAPNLELMFQGQLVSVPRSESFRQIWDPSDRHMYPIALANMGAVHCYEYSHLATQVLPANHPAYKGEEHLEGPGAASGTVKLSFWSPNRLEYEVDAPAPATLVVNQNTDESWQLAEGQGQVVREPGQLRVQLPAGAQHLALAYVSQPFRLGLALSLLGLALTVGLFWREARRPA